MWRLTLLFEANPLKKLYRGDILAILPPFVAAARPILSNLEADMLRRDSIEMR